LKRVQNRAKGVFRHRGERHSRGPLKMGRISTFLLEGNKEPGDPVGHGKKKLPDASLIEGTAWGDTMSAASETGEHASPKRRKPKRGDVDQLPIERSEGSAGKRKRRSGGVAKE